MKEVKFLQGEQFLFLTFVCGQLQDCLQSKYYIWFKPDDCQYSLPKIKVWNTSNCKIRPLLLDIKMSLNGFITRVGFCKVFFNKFLFTTTTKTVKELNLLQSYDNQTPKNVCKLFLRRLGNTSFNEDYNFVFKFYKKPLK